MPLYYFFLIPITGLWFVSFIKAIPIIKKELKLNSISFEDEACHASLAELEKKEPKLNSISFNQGGARPASLVKKVLIGLFSPYLQLSRRDFHTTNSPKWLIPDAEDLFSRIEYNDQKNLNMYEFNKYLNKPIKKITGLNSSIFILIISYIIYLCFDLSTNQFQFVREYYNLGFFDLSWGIDGSSIYFVVRPSEIRFRKSFRCKGKIIKFREFLKIMVPSCNWKIKSGWTNSSCKVISPNMIKREIDNRGSKPAIPLMIKNGTVVKEQRVDGSYTNSVIKCILTDFERSCQVKIPSNQQIPLFYETSIASSLTLSYCPYSAESKKLSFRFAGNRSFMTTTRLYHSPAQAGRWGLNGRSLDPWFVTGFADAEGSFIIHIRKLPRNNTGWRVEGRFKITLHKKDIALLKQLQKFFKGVGKIGENGKDTLSLDIRSIEELYTVILPHFNSYSLITQKKVDFELFKRVIEKIKNREHLTDVGVQEIVNIRASMNKGLSDELKEAFPNTKNFPLPEAAALRRFLSINLRTANLAQLPRLQPKYLVHSGLVVLPQLREVSVLNYTKVHR